MAKRISGAAASNVQASSAGAKVIVASKLPMAIELQCCEKRIQHMKNGNNAWNEDVYVKSGRIVTIAGTAYPAGQPPKGMPERPLIVAGAALTFGVDKDFWDRWLEENAKSPMVVNGMVFAHENQDDVRAEARDRVEDLSGLDGLNPDGDRRMPKKLSGTVGSVTVGAEAAHAAAE